MIGLKKRGASVLFPASQRSLPVGDQDKWGKVEELKIFNSWANIRSGLWHCTLSNFSWAFSIFCSQATKFGEKRRQQTCDSQSLFISAMICYWPFKVGCSLTPKQMTITQELERRHQWSCLKNMIQTHFSHDCWSLLFGAENDGADPNSFIPPACPVIWYCHTQWNIQLIASWWFIAKTRTLTECFIVTLWQLEMAIQRNSVGKSKVMENLDFGRG